MTDPHDEILNFPLPDMTPRYEMTVQQMCEADVTIRGRPFLLRAYFTPEQIANPQHASPERVPLEIYLHVPGLGMCARMRGAMCRCPVAPERYREDEAVHQYWRVYNREVPPPWRRQGLATFLLAVYERQVRRLADTFPYLKAEWIHLDTRLSAIAGLAIGLGFVPHPKDEGDVATLLAEGTTEMVPTNERPELRFWKPL